MTTSLLDMAQRFVCNKARTEFREQLSDECRDFDGRLVLPAKYRVIQRDDIVKRFGEEIIPLIPALQHGLWRPGPELLELQP